VTSQSHSIIPRLRHTEHFSWNNRYLNLYFQAQRRNNGQRGGRPIATKVENALEIKSRTESPQLVDSDRERRFPTASYRILPRRLILRKSHSHRCFYFLSVITQRVELVSSLPLRSHLIITPSLSFCFLAAVQESRGITFFNAVKKKRQS
jgi:hypothetical protein